MNGKWFSRTGLIVSLLLLFFLQAFLPLSFRGFNVSPLKWFFLQSVLFVVFAVLVLRLLFTSSSDSPMPESNSALKKTLQNQNIIDLQLLIGAVVHEIRTPLNKLTLLLNQEESLEKQLKIEETLGELSSTVDHIEDVFRNQNPDCHWISTVRFVSLIQDGLGSEQDVRYQVGTDWLYLDPSKMKLTVLNLVQNGLEAYEEGGVVDVRLGSVGPEWCITISDSAGGMDPDTARVISSRDRENDSDSGGMGLGLLIAQRIVENHNGRMVVESDPPDGTDITVTLPKPSSG